MTSLRIRLIAAFLGATLVPLIVTLGIMTSLLEYSLNYATTEELDRLSKSLEATGREYYQQMRETLRTDVQGGSIPYENYLKSDQAAWPNHVAAFGESGEPERFVLSGTDGDQIEYLVRHDGDVWVYKKLLGGVRMGLLSEQYRDARELVARAGARDLRRGFTTTLIVLVAAVWLVSFLWLIYVANRISRPIQQLTAGLAELADGNLQIRINVKRNDEVGRAINAFNHTAVQLQHNRDRLVYLTQVASWQLLARKMAHELKNSLTPIRLIMEETLARRTEADPQFMAQAAQIVISEVESLERRVRAFSDFSSEPALRPVALDINAAVEERVSLLKSGHGATAYDMELTDDLPVACVDSDRLKGILTNLLENAAEAAGFGGRVLVRSYISGDRVHVEIHDSGPGLSEEALGTLFEPTITFKDRGMGLGLMIARKNALVCGGDLLLVKGLRGGAGFRVVLPRWKGAVIL